MFIPNAIMSVAYSCRMHVFFLHKTSCFWFFQSSARLCFLSDCKLGKKDVYSFNPTAYIFWFMLHNEEDLASIKTLYKITAKSVLWLFLGKTYEVLQLSRLWAGTAGSGAEKHNTSINHPPNNNVLSVKNDNMITHRRFAVATWGARPELCPKIISTNMQEFNSSAARHLIT